MTVKQNIGRTHDKIYLAEDRKNKPKEYFKFIDARMRSFIQEKKAPRLLDVGCATGDFLYYLSTLYPHAELTGMDVMPELIERMKRAVPGVRVLKADISKKETLPKQTFDIVCMLGVHSIFEDCRPILHNLLDLIGPGGRGYVFGIFNPEDLDVLIRVRPSCSDGPWETGWNLFSRATISSYLHDLNVAHSFYDFMLDIDIPKNGDDPLRTWTVNLENGKLVQNGIQLIHTFALLELCL